MWTPATSNPTPSSLQPSSSSTHPTQPAPSSTQTSQPTRVSTLSDLHTQTQAQLSTLDAKLARLSSTLTSLTDEILRCGGRLAYEVEILGADAGGLAEVLRRGRGDQDGLGRFIGADTAAVGPQEGNEAQADDEAEKEAPPNGSMQVKSTSNRPEALQQLHTLSLLRSRLTTVISTFDAALAWPLPPSSTSSARNFISVSAPTSSNGNAANGSKEDLEAKGQAFEAQIKEEIADLMEDGEEGVLAARRKVRELKELCEVWKGTVEERARGRLVEGLGRMVGGIEGLP